MTTFLAPALGFAQDVDPRERERDSLRVHQLSEVVVVAPPSTGDLSVATVTHVAVTDIDAVGARAVDQLAPLVPAAHVQTNSRGETLVYLRNAGERQVSVLFDGALLNVPWDNRVDLSLIPAAAVGGVSVVKGVPPVEYGTNVLGGAVNLTSRMFDGAGTGAATDLTASYGTLQALQGALAHRGRAGAMAYSTAVAYSATDGVPVPSGAGLPYSQPASGARTNTDSRIANAFGRIVYEWPAGTRVGIGLLHVDAEKGVAPEGSKDPAVSSVRFWRYPLWRNSVGILSAEGPAGRQTDWKGAAWINRFAQTIDAYTAADYQSYQAREEDHDLTIGGRLIAQRRLRRSSVKLALNGLTSRHRQRDLALEASGQPVAGETAPQLQYRQHLVSVGLEYGMDPLARLHLTAGASVDAMFAPETGDKPPRDALADGSFTLGTVYEGRAGWFVRGSAGRKVRFPTMRELFGEALNRFLVNPDLEPEASILTELGVGVRTARASGEVIPFATFTSHTIDQRSVTVPGETRPRRQRVNLRGSRVLGVEIVGAARARGDLWLEGHLTLMDVRRLTDTPGEPVYLSEKPGAVGRLAARYTPRSGIVLQVEGVYTGRAYSLDDDGAFVPLPRSLSLNLRAAYRFAAGIASPLELFLRADNVTDAVVVPQLGLPAAGRTWHAGLRAEM